MARELALFAFPRPRPGGETEMGITPNCSVPNLCAKVPECVKTCESCQVVG